MTAFQITRLDKSDKGKEKLLSAIEKNIAEVDRVVIDSDGIWLVKFQGNAAELSLKLGTNDGSCGQVLIVEILNFSGYGPVSISSWFKG